MKNILLLVWSLAFISQIAIAQNSKEAEYYKMSTLPTPPHVHLEVGGMMTTEDGNLAVATRKGDVWLIKNPYEELGLKTHFQRYATGLHEPLGIAYKNGDFLVAQRSELTRLKDRNRDGKADSYQTITAWASTGHYHEYNFGPFFHPNGDMLVSMNVSFGNPDWWKAYSKVKWRGWLIRINEKGEITPFTAGLRSPVGVFINKEGDIFYSENQGDWVGSGWIQHLQEGKFNGAIAGLAWQNEPESKLKVDTSMIPKENDSITFPAMTERIKNFQLPAVWFPHSLMGQSLADIKQDNTNGAFGPFAGHYFVADQNQARIMRFTMEKINGVYQGACYAFREGFESGILRMSWGKDGSLFAGMTDRGWKSIGKKDSGIQRLIWTGKVPFEIKEVKAMPDGFEIEFTLPADKKTLTKIAHYKMSSFTYLYWSKYGSPIVENEPIKIKGLKISEDGKKVRVVVENWRKKYIHAIELSNITDEKGIALLHNTAFYTLNEIPTGTKLNENELTAKATDADQQPKTEMHAHHHGHHDMKAADIPATAKRVNIIPEAWEGKTDFNINIGTAPGLQYNLKEFTVKAGGKVALTFSNTDDMLHNLVIVPQGKGMEAGNLAMAMGMDGPNKGYIPESPLVMYHTGVVQPASSETIYFIAPSTPGTYTYVCTYPGHAAVMQGVMIVTP